VRKDEDSSSSFGYTVIPCSGIFIQTPTEAKIWVGVADIQLIVTKLPGESTRHVRFDDARVSLAKNQISRLDVD